jgi:hypothetical protein
VRNAYRLLAIGYWLFARGAQCGVGDLRFAICDLGFLLGYWLLAIGYSRVARSAEWVICDLRFAICDSSLAIGYRPLAIRAWREAAKRRLLAGGGAC